MRIVTRTLLTAAIASGFASLNPACAQPRPPEENWQITTAAGEMYQQQEQKLEVTTDGSLIFSSRVGDVWLVIAAFPAASIRCVRATVLTDGHGNGFNANFPQPCPK